MVESRIIVRICSDAAFCGALPTGCPTHCPLQPRACSAEHVCCSGLRNDAIHVQVVRKTANLFSVLGAQISSDCDQLIRRVCCATAPERWSCFMIDPTKRSQGRVLHAVMQCTCGGGNTARLEASQPKCNKCIRNNSNANVSNAVTNGRVNG